KLKAYYDHWTTFWTTRMFTSDWYQSWKLATPRKEYLNLYGAGYLKLITKQELADARQLLEDALALTTPNTAEHIRVSSLIKSFDYYEAAAISYPRTEETAVPITEAAALALFD